MAEFKIKQRITRYWTCRAESFEAQRLREYESSKKERWLAEFHKYLPAGRQLRILDIGTGTGFFACLLAEEGHRVSGIDLTPEMVGHARHMSSVLGLEIDFQVMDAEETDFPSDHFDALVTRNLTWTLPDMGKAYREWYRILKPDGILINFDADYCGPSAQDDKPLPDNHAHKNIPEFLIRENEAISKELAAGQERRPQWDYQLLSEAGFEKIIIDTDVWKRIYQEIDEFYNPVPIFTISACKGGQKR